MDVRFFNPFISAIQSVFKTTLKTEILISKPRVERKDEADADVSAIIGFSGGAMGSVALCFPMKTAVAAASKLTDTELHQDHPDFADALGELANRVAGQAKAQLHGEQISISVPSVAMGAAHCVLKSQRMPALMLLCDSVLGRFSVRVTMTANKNTNSQTPVRAVGRA
ncbi:MAG: chemotaxis protein CheX [Phycisphaerales bacterium]|nr:MAG: chemotaxis protein CheX [Phycisphaerales bacterium]